MKREPDHAEVIDDSGNYDVRDLRKEVVYVERPSKKPDWLVVTATTILAGAVFAAWTANARLAALETTVADLKEQIAELKQIVGPHYRGGSDASNPR
jgi:hypothetical protein